MGGQFKKIISCEEFEPFLTNSTRCDVRTSACSHSSNENPSLPPFLLFALCMWSDSDFPWEAVWPWQEVRCGAVQCGAVRRRDCTWYSPCSVPTRRVTSSTTDRSCCSSCSSWYSRGGPRTALPEREARYKTERLLRSPPGWGKEKTATSKILKEGRNKNTGVFFCCFCSFGCQII